jgi:hypothetical protein
VEVEAQIAELGILGTDESEFFVAAPGFELLFAADGTFDLAEGSK